MPASRFKRIPTPEDIKILFSDETKFPDGPLKDLKVLFRVWERDNIRKETVIFIDRNVVQYSDEVLMKEVKKSAMDHGRGDSHISIQKLEGFTFVDLHFINS